MSGSETGELKVWDLRSKKEIITVQAHPGAVTSVDVLPQKFAITGGDDGKTNIWDLKTGQQIKPPTPIDHKDAITRVRVVPSKSWIVTASRDRTV